MRLVKEIQTDRLTARGTVSESVPELADSSCLCCYRGYKIRNMLTAPSSSKWFTVLLDDIAILPHGDDSLQCVSSCSSLPNHLRRHNLLLVLASTTAVADLCWYNDNFLIHKLSVLYIFPPSEELPPVSDSTMHACNACIVQLELIRIEGSQVDYIPCSVETIGHTVQSSLESNKMRALRPNQLAYELFEIQVIVICPKRFKSV